MQRRVLFLILLALSLIASACTGKTALRFSNETECGAATIKLTNTASGSLQEITVEQGKSVTVEMKPQVEYQYEVSYPRQPGYITCDTKNVTTQLEKAQTLTVRLTSVRDVSVLTPEPMLTPAN